MSSNTVVLRLTRHYPILAELTWLIKNYDPEVIANIEYVISTEAIENDIKHLKNMYNKLVVVGYLPRTVLDRLARDLGSYIDDIMIPVYNTIFQIDRESLDEVIHELDNILWEITGKQLELDVNVFVNCKAKSDICIVAEFLGLYPYRGGGVEHGAIANPQKL